MIGAFSASESTHAAKLLHLTPDDTPRATREIRLLCLESIEKVYTLLKPAVSSPFFSLPLCFLRPLSFFLFYSNLIRQNCR